jgi:CelD/BcsL family acetyltransferase involved in cellulose biosynthesis
VSNPLEFAALEGSWNSLYDSVDNATLFNSWDWLYTWWEVYAECDLRDLFILCFYEEDQLVGIAPFQIERKYPHTYIQGRTLRFLASGECLKDNVATPFVDLLILPEYENAVIANLESALHSYSNRWDFAEFDFLLEDALIFRCFKGTDSIHKQCYSNGFRYEVPTVADQTAYIETLARRWKKDFNKKDRVLNKAGELTIRQSGLDDLNESMDLLQEMHRDRWQSRASFLVFESEHFDQFHRKILATLIPKNKAYIKTLYLNDEPLSCYYAFEDKNQIHYYQSAFYSKNANRFMPLFYLVCKEIGKAMEQGKRYDFMFDDNPDSYKKNQYSAAAKPMYRLVLTASRYRLMVFNLYKKYKFLKKKFNNSQAAIKKLPIGKK